MHHDLLCFLLSALNCICCFNLDHDLAKKPCFSLWSETIEKLNDAHFRRLEKIIKNNYLLLINNFTQCFPLLYNLVDIHKVNYKSNYCYAYNFKFQSKEQLILDLKLLFKHLQGIFFQNERNQVGMSFLFTTVAISYNFFDLKPLDNYFFITFFFVSSIEIHEKCLINYRERWKFKVYFYLK